MGTELETKWSFTFRRNVHMYCHDLRASRDGVEHQIQCEDLSGSKDQIGIWPYQLELDQTTYSTLIEALIAWANGQKLNYQIYVTRDDCETNLGF